MVVPMIPRRVCYFANLSMKLCMPSTLDNIREIAFKTQKSATKIEIKRYLESVYGFEIERVDTLCRRGRKKRFGNKLLSKSDYKKAYVTLKNTLSLSPNLYPIPLIQKEAQRVLEKQKPYSKFIGTPKEHWMKGQETRLNGRYARFGAKSWAKEKFSDGRQGPYSYGANLGKPEWNGWYPRRRPRPQFGGSRKPGYDVGRVTFPFRGPPPSGFS